MTSLKSSRPTSQLFEAKVVHTYHTSRYVEGHLVLKEVMARAEGAIS